MNGQNYLAFFAAANGYSGFRSYFHEVFPSEDFKRIYIIKGGPGTGKSSFMKRFLRDASEFAEEAIYCSSDTSSLDGVILSGDGGRVALLDGTAPHIRDAEIPGAIDEILNFGDYWDSRWLTAKREDIIALNREKSRAYKTAYCYLSLAGKTKDAEHLKMPPLESRIITELVGVSDKSSEYKRKVRLLSSFGKAGLTHISNPTAKAARTVEIRGEEKAMLLCNRIAKYLSDNSIGHTLFPFALDGSLAEAIFIPDSDTAIVAYSTDGAADTVIDAEEYFPTPDRTELEGRRVALEYYREFMTEAVRWFKIASELHGELEGIYSSAMDYELVDGLFIKKHGEILNILKS